jgi:hypothetical protein
MTYKHYCAVSIAASLLVPTLCLAADWPQYRGPRGDGISTEDLSIKPFPTSGPKVVWKVPMRNGFSSFAVSGNRVYTQLLHLLFRHQRLGSGPHKRGHPFSAGRVGWAGWGLATGPGRRPKGRSVSEAIFTTLPSCPARPACALPLPESSPALFPVQLCCAFVVTFPGLRCLTIS